MEFAKTQLGSLLERVKIAMLAGTPVVYIPTNQLEVINDLLYNENCIDALVPRLWYNAKDGKVEKIPFGKNGTVDDNGKFLSIIDNYIVGSIDPDSIKVPSILISYTAEWKTVYSGVKNYIESYLGLKKGKGYQDPHLLDSVRRSLCIIITPIEQSIPLDIAPYTKTIKIPTLTDEEIESAISEHLSKEHISLDVVSGTLLSQMIISFRGFSLWQIHQTLSQVIAEQKIDFEGIDGPSVLSVIRESKKQQLEDSQGLKWETVNTDGVAGLDCVINWLTARRRIFEDPERAILQHIDIPNGILMSGIPGSGKSLVAKTAAKILNLPLISLDMGALLGGILGESEHNMINALSMAEQMAPCVLWIDEIEKAFSGSSSFSSSSDGGVGLRMFGKFLTWMQEKSAACFVFATSNDITSLPPELFRSERFDRKFFTFMPTAEECAKIFAANIKSQNDKYRKRLENLPKRFQIIQAKNLFEPTLENPDVWLDVLNNYCTSDIKLCNLKDKNEGKRNKSGDPIEPVYVWSTTSRPKNKLMTGADISALIREAKFMIHPDPFAANMQSTIYGEVQLKNAVKTIMKEKSFKPYGETNLKDIVLCFEKLYENEFTPASDQFILDFDEYDAENRIYKHNPNSDKNWKNPYDKVLYYTIVGAINYYSSNRMTNQL